MSKRRRNPIVRTKHPRADTSFWLLPRDHPRWMILDADERAVCETLWDHWVERLAEKCDVELHEADNSLRVGIVVGIFTPSVSEDGTVFLQVDERMAQVAVDVLEEKFR